MNTKRRLLIAALENDERACKVIDRLALAINETARREYVWRGKANLKFGRVEPIHDNVRPILLKGAEGFDLGMFEGSEDCARGEGILVVTWNHRAIPLDITVFPPRTYFRSMFLEGESLISGMRKIMLLSDRDEPGNFEEMVVKQATSAIMTSMTNGWVDGLLFRRPVIATASAPTDAPPVGA